MKIDVSKLDMICGEAGDSAIYEDGDYWVATDSQGKFDKRIIKSDFPFWPLSAVTKYDMEPVNNKRLEELGEELGRRLAASKAREALEAENA
jgi:hypothetical protein